MADKQKERKSSFKLSNILNFFHKLMHSSQPNSPVEVVFSAERVNCEPAVQEVLIYWPTANESNLKENYESKTSSKDFQGKDNKDLTRPVEREVGMRECVTDYVKTDEEQQWERNLIQNQSKSVERPTVQSDSPKQCELQTKEEQPSAQNFIRNRSRQDRSKSVERPTAQSDSPRQCKLKTKEEQPSAQNFIRNRSRQDRSKSVERLGNKQHSVQSYLPKPCKFKTEDGRWFCQVCSWSSSNSTLTSFLDHCSSRNHRERIKARFNMEQELGELHPYNLSKVGNKTDEPQADSQDMIWSERKEDGEISVVKAKKQQGNIEQQKEKLKICNTKKPSTEMICKSQQTQNRVCQESSKQEGLTSRMKDLLKELPIQEEFKTLAMTNALPKNKTLSDKRVNEIKPEVCSFKEQLFEVVRQEKAEIRKDQRKRAKKKTEEKTNLDENKTKTDSKVNTKGGEGSSQNEDLRITEIKKMISAFGITFIEPVSVSFLNCKVCEKLVPAGSDFETLVINVGIHVDGKPHLKRLDGILESSHAVVNLMKAIR